LIPATIRYPEELPVARERARILAALADHPVLVLAGDTGSGKTTQLPKLCLELGRGVHGMIGHTQPRRIAAQAVAARIAEELGTTGDSRVAAQIRFQDRSTPETLVKVMTDGILLAEIPRDRRLRRYDTIIIDEAHERSLNIDFLLGYLKRLLPERPDLKLVITSATIDVERFSRHFGNAPVIEVSGRTYPVEVWYRPPPEEEPDLPQAIVGAIGELIAHERGTPHAGRGDVLVFHAGERDIRESALAIRRSGIPNLEVLPLYSRLPQAEQQRVLAKTGDGLRFSAGKPGPVPTFRGRRVVLATNVAETSLTVPGIRYVIDPGLARLSRYSVRSKVQRLPIEPVSQASAEQRKGRCGRLSDGICVRLYSAPDFAQRPAFTDPEILRTNLAAVVLQMHALGLGEVARFPFLDPPEERQVNDGVRLLEELGALGARKLTAIGRALARLPVDPRIARMLLAGAERGALAEMLVIASFLSIQDPRERPADKQQAADQSHRRFACETSDFVAMLNLWRYAEEQRQALSASAWRRLCQREFLSWLRMREWRDIHLQLRLLGRELGLRENHEPAHPDALHRAIVAGMLSHIGTRTEERDYAGVRGRRFAIHPGSALFRKQPKWLVAAELVETARLYARHCAAIQPEWVFPYAEPLVKREHHTPHWSARSGKVLATELVRLFGLLVSDQRRVDFSRIDPVAARRLFIQSALVEGDYRSTRRFWQHNRALLAEIEELEARGRRRDLLVEDRVLFDWYDERLPRDVCDHPALEKWLRRELPRHPEALCMPRELLLRRTGEEPVIAQFPDALEWDGLRVPLTYRYEPGHPADGVTAVLPLALLERFPQHLPEWLVPGLLRDKLIALLKALPKQHRRPLVPVPDTVDGLLGAIRPCDRPLAEVVGEELRERLRLAIPREAWAEEALDPFYRMNLRLVAADGAIVAEGRDRAALRAQWIDRSRGEVQRAAPAKLAREGLSAWDFGALPASVTVRGAGLEVPGYPVLRDRGESVAIETLTDPYAAAETHRAGVRRLVLLADRQGSAYLRRNLLRDARAVLALGQRIERAALVEDLLLAAADECLPEDAALPRDPPAFTALAARVSAQIAARAQRLEALLAAISRELQGVASRRAAIDKPPFASMRADIEAQLARLLPPGFLAATPRAWRERLPVYIAAIAVRMERIGQRLPRDQECTRELAMLQARLEDWRASGKAADAARAALATEYRWMLEEYRVSLFAQQLGTRGTVSRKRLDRLWESVLV
jgi:ATP-dependent helicase HrpA